VKANRERGWCMAPYYKVQNKTQSARSLALIQKTREQ
jgi:hypothetical protein